MITRAMTGVLGAMTMIVAGCGYSNAPLFPDDVQTVAVSIFANKSSYRGTEFDLTEAIVKQVELQTPYKVVPNDHAQTLLEGTIVSVDQQRLSRRSTGSVPQELEMRIVVDFHWKDLRTGELLRERKGFARVGRYVPTSPMRESLEIAQHEAVGRLAQSVVSAMQDDW